MILPWTETVLVAVREPRTCRGFFAIGGATVAVVATLASGIAVRAAPLPGGDRAISYAVVDQDVAGVIAGIASQIGLRAEVSAHVHGTVHGRMQQGDAAGLLDRLGALYGFDWFTDGHTLYASAYDEAKRDVLTLGPVAPDELRAALDALGVLDGRWPVRQAGDLVFVSGPPRYVAMVRETFDALSARERVAVADVHVFRGNAPGT